MRGRTDDAMKPRMKHGSRILVPVKYDAGLAVHINGYIMEGVPWDQLPKDADRHHYYIEKCSADKWAIRSGTYTGRMSKSEDAFVYEPQPSSRTDKFLDDCSFDSAEEAAEFLVKWRRREYDRVKNDPGFKVWGKT